MATVRRSESASALPSDVAAELDELALLVALGEVSLDDALALQERLYQEAQP